MKFFAIKLFFNLLVLSLVSGCASMTRPERPQIKLAQDVQVREASSEQSIAKKKGDVVELTQAPLIIEKAGYISTVVVPLNNESANIELNLRPYKEWGGPEIEGYANQVISEIFDEVTDVQILLSQNEAEQALAKILEVKKKYPKVSYLKFLEASARYLLNQRKLALQILEAALIEFPNSPKANLFYQSIGGRKPSSLGAAPNKE